MSRLSTSSINTFFDCPALWEFKYIHKLEEPSSDSFEASYGRAFHGLLESDTTHLEHFGPKWQAIIRAHHFAYVQRWSAKHEQHWLLNYHDHEIKFDFELAPGYEYHGIVDGVAELGGENYLVESKTTGTKFPDFMKYKEHGTQPNLYLLAAKHSPVLQPYNIKGVIYDVTNRPSIKQKKRSNETDQAYVDRCAAWFLENKETAFNRALITRDQSYLDSFAADVMMVSDAIEQKLFYRNTSSCYKYRRQCGVFSKCFEQAPLTNFEQRKRR